MTTRSGKPTPVEPAVLAADLRALTGKLKRAFREHSDAGDFTPSQAAVLQRLERDGPAPVSDLARAEGLRHQTMRITVAALEAAGHVEGHPDPNDGRQTIISLTDAFRQWITEGRAARQDWLARRIAEKLSPNDQRTLGIAVEMLKRAIDD